jgi:hypothetical protein
MRPLYIAPLLLLLACSGTLPDRVSGNFELITGFTRVTPGGWRLRGVEHMIAYTDDTIARSAPHSGGIALGESFKEDVAELTQWFSAERYVGQRVRFGAYIKTNSVRNACGLRMRIRSESQEHIEFDDMSDRPVHGTSDWTYYESVLNVPEESVLIEITVFLIGSGQLWIDDASF